MQEEEGNTDKLEKIVSSILNHVKQKIENTSTNYLYNAGGGGEYW